MISYLFGSSCSSSSSSCCCCCNYYYYYYIIIIYYYYYILLLYIIIIIYYYYYILLLLLLLLLLLSSSSSSLLLLKEMLLKAMPRVAALFASVVGQTRRIRRWVQNFCMQLGCKTKISIDSVTNRLVKVTLVMGFDVFFIFTLGVRSTNGSKQKQNSKR